MADEPPRCVVCGTTIPEGHALKIAPRGEIIHPACALAYNRVMQGQRARTTLATNGQRASA